MNGDGGHYQMVLCTCPDRAEGEAIAQALVGARLAACVNIIDAVTSVYEWNGQIHKDGEVLLIVKTRADHFDALRNEIVHLHPYELPEVLAVAVDSGLAPYLRWIDQCLTTER